MSSKNGLCILNLNIQNIFSKFDELKLFVTRVALSKPISVICLNECWIDNNSYMSDIEIDNYKMFFQRGQREGHGHCGLVMYVHDQYKCKEITIQQESTAWDYMCVEISHCKPNSKKHITCNLYRLPGGNIEDYTIFENEFASFLDKMKQLKHSCFVSGDFNINLLAMNIKPHISSYFDRVISKGFFPLITLPTRIQPPSHTLIDNIYANKLEDISKLKSGILINDISDHKMIFTYQESDIYIDQVEKYIEIEKKDDISFQNFVN